MANHRIRDLARATGVTARTIRFYVACKLLPPPSGRGTGPIYSDEHLLRLRAIRRLRAERLPLDAIARRLAKLSPAELATLGATPAPKAAAAPTLTTPAATPAGEATSSLPAERWERVVLLPGLELHLRADGGPLLRRLAEEIHTRYALRAPAPSLQMNPSGISSAPSTS